MEAQVIHPPPPPPNFVVSENGPCSEDGVTRLTHFSPPSRVTRLPDFGPTTHAVGRLEMCHDGYWGSVCNDFAGAETAAVACRQLGYDVIGQMMCW